MDYKEKLKEIKELYENLLINLNGPKIPYAQPPAPRKRVAQRTKYKGSLLRSVCLLLFENSREASARTGPNKKKEGPNHRSSAFIIRGSGCGSLGYGVTG